MSAVNDILSIVQMHTFVLLFVNQPDANDRVT